jgi:hypothetical protein
MAANSSTVHARMKVRLFITDRMKVKGTQKLPWR